MALSDEDRAYVQDLFSGLGDVTTRRMFGGLGVYHDGRIFALMRSDGALLIKGQGDFVQYLEMMGYERWRYTRKGGAEASMPYWSIPESARDDPEEAVALARAAFQHL